MSAGVKKPHALTAAVTFSLPSPYLFLGDHDHVDSMLSVRPVVALRRRLIVTAAFWYFEAS